MNDDMENTAKKLQEAAAKAKLSARADSLAFAMGAPGFSSEECHKYLKLAISTDDSSSCLACAEWLRERAALSLEQQIRMLSEVFFLQKPAIFAALATCFPEAAAAGDGSDIDMPRSILAMALASGDQDAAVGICLTLGLLPQGAERAGQAIEQGLLMCANPPGAAHAFARDSLCSESKAAAIAAQCERALIAMATSDPCSARRPSPTL